MKVALFGGSFNPVHNSHIAIAEQILANNLANEVWFMPCGNHAFGKKLASNKDRVAMIEKAIGDNANFKLSTIDLTETPSLTADTIRTLRSRYEDKEFLFVIGADALTEIEQWHDYEYLCNEVGFIVVERENYVVDKNTPVKIVAIITKDIETSSTEIRERITEKKAIKGLVPKIVNDYLVKEELYQ